MKITDNKEINRLKKWGEAHPDYKAKYYLCRVSAEKMNAKHKAGDGWPEHKKDHWGVYTKGMNAYMCSDKRYPVENELTAEEVEEAIKQYKESR